jgi:hypothetical protein
MAAKMNRAKEVKPVRIALDRMVAWKGGDCVGSSVGSSGDNRRYADHEPGCKF